MKKVLSLIAFLLFTFLIIFPQNVSASVIYVIQPGDTINKIANQYGVSADSLLRINAIKDSNVIVPGQAFLIDGFTYIVQPGENLWEIAQRHRLSIGTLTRHNGLKSQTITPGQKLKIPVPAKQNIAVGTYIYPKDEKTDKWLIERNRTFLTSVAAFEYHPDYNAEISLLWRDKDVVSLLWKNNISPYATVTNLSSKGFDHELSHHLLSSPARRKKLVNNIYFLLNKNNYKGVVIDFEGLKPEDRTNFNLFMKELSVKLHKNKMNLAIAVPPMQGARFPAWNAAYDYKTLGKYVDFMFLMTYDWHWMQGPPGPIAPIGKVRETVEYAASVMPRSKILLGIAMYAYDWTLSEGNKHEAKAYSQKFAVERALTHYSPILYHQQSASPYFKYTDEKGTGHEVWFEDARSVLAKYRLVKELKLGGVGGWQLGLPFPQAGRLLSEEFTVR